MTAWPGGALGKATEGQQLIHGAYFCTTDIAFHRSTCQHLPVLAPAPSPYPGSGRGMKKMGREQGGGCCLGNGGCRWHRHEVAGPHTGGGRELLATCARLSFAKYQRDVGHR